MLLALTWTLIIRCWILVIRPFSKPVWQSTYRFLASLPSGILVSFLRGPQTQGLSSGLWGSVLCGTDPGLPIGEGDQKLGVPLRSLYGGGDWLLDMKIEILKKYRQVL